jgi:zinc transport system substrate-binding protein
MRDIVRIVGDALIAAEPDQTDAYRARMATLDAQLAELDAEYRAGLASCQRRTIVTAHEAFGWLAQRYNLTQYGIAGLEPDTEPSAARLAELADLARDQGVTTIFTEELVSPKVAETVAREAGGLKVETLSPLESLTEEQADAGDDYFSVMRANLAELRGALGCS